SKTGVRTWDLATGELTPAVEDVQARQRQPLSLCILPDRTLLTAFSDGVVEALDLSTGKPLPALPRSWKAPGHIALDDLAASQDGNRVAVFSYTHDAVRVFDRANLSSDQTFNAYAQAMAISADGRRLAMSDGDDVVVWDIDSHERIAQLKGHRSSVAALAFSPDGRLLASGSNDRNIRIWNLDAKASETLSGHRGELNALVFSPDGQLLASGDQRGELKFWFLVEATELISIDAALPIYKLAFVSGGDRLAVQTAKQIRILNGTPAGFGSK
ncbi:MAG: WD40 repeat domain-containing protein, partial [Planctomycetaceae bacterium]